MTEQLEKSVAELLLDIFGGNDYFAKSRYPDKTGYEPVLRPLCVSDIEEHLAGTITLGSYPVSQDIYMVRWIGWDIDAEGDPKTAREYALRVQRYVKDVPHVMEFSGNKGYHIFVFLSEPIPASLAKEISEFVREKEGLSKSTQRKGTPHVECYPKQDKVSKENLDNVTGKGFGNLIKIPLGKHPITHNWSCFIDPENGWEEGDLLDPILCLKQRASKEQAVSIMGAKIDPMDELVKLISQYWIAGQRHEMSLYISGYLAQENWGYDQASELIRMVCGYSNDAEDENRLQTVKATFDRYANNKSVRGRQGLAEILPVTALQKLAELVSQIRTPDSVRQIDDLRYKEEPDVEKARKAAVTIWHMLNEESSRVFKTVDKKAYYYNGETHEVTQTATQEWFAQLNKFFGLNVADRWSKLVIQNIDDTIVNESPILPVYKTSHWNTEKQKLYVNLGGPEVYILDGTVIEKDWNGECGVMFQTSLLSDPIIPDFDSNMNAWEHIADDLSFTTSSEAPATPEQQRELLKAWILSYFFMELMQSKPILTLIGQPGSGKTTAMRRIVRVLEGLGEDVLGIQMDKPDSIRASIERHRLIVLDNLEKSGVGWLVDTLNRLSTGQKIELRELYRTNSVHVIQPKCFVSCTAISMPFSDEALFTRLLILEMDKVAKPEPEHWIQEQLVLNAEKIWGALLDDLNSAVASVRKNVRVRVPPNNRLADFTAFCARLKDCAVIDYDLLRKGIESMTNAQMRQLKESSPAMSLLEEWIDMHADEAAQPHSMNEIYAVLSTMAKSRNLPFRWTSASALEKHLEALEEQLIVEFQATIDMYPVPGEAREVKKIKFKTML